MNTTTITIEEVEDGFYVTLEDAGSRQQFKINPVRARALILNLGTALALAGSNDGVLEHADCEG